MNVYLVIQVDRHTDDVIEVFRNNQSACNRALEIIDQIHKSSPRDYIDFKPETLNDNMRKAGWLFYESYSCEGDHVRVEVKELIEGGI